MQDRNTMGEGSHVVEFEKARLNVWNVSAVVVAGFIQAFIAGGIYVQMNNKISDLDERITAEQVARKDRGILTDGRFKDLNEQMKLLTQLQYTMQSMNEATVENKTTIIETNKRIDRVVESFGGKMDVMIDGLNKVITSVEVLKSRIDDKKVQPTAF